MSDPHPADPLRDLGASFRVAALQLERTKDDKGAEQLRRWAATVNAEPGIVLDALLAVANRLRRPVHLGLLRCFTREEYMAARERAKEP